MTGPEYVWSAFAGGIALSFLAGLLHLVIRRGMFADTVSE